MKKKTENPTKIVEGYVVKFKEKNYLTATPTKVPLLLLTEHDSPDEARVFSLEELENIKKTMGRKFKKIEILIPATWSHEGGVTITGKPIKAKDLPSLRER